MTLPRLTLLAAALTALIGDGNASEIQRPRVLGLAPVAFHGDARTAPQCLLKYRPLPAGCNQPSEIRVGPNGRWQLSGFDPDGSRFELMEPGAFNGQPVPPSEAPPPGNRSTAMG